MVSTNDNMGLLKGSPSRLQLDRDLRVRVVGDRTHPFVTQRPAWMGHIKLNGGDAHSAEGCLSLGDNGESNERVSLLLNDLNTLLVIMADRDTFCVLRRSESGKKAIEDLHRESSLPPTAYAMICVMAGLVPRLLEHSYHHTSILAHHAHQIIQVAHPPLV